MKIGIAFLVLGVVIALFIGFLLGKSNCVEKFTNEGSCNICNKKPCGCFRRRLADDNDAAMCQSCNIKPCECLQKRNLMGSNTNSASTSASASCPPCLEPDPTRYVLKTSVPPCPPMPDMTRYMLKTECPSIPDMSKYVLKASVPNCPPCISTCTKPCKIGECPPCPRTRCPVVQCPEPKACPACPTATCSPCPEPNIKCNASYEPANKVRPMLASTSVYGLQ